MDNIFMNSENSKIYDLHILLLNPNNNNNNNNNNIVFLGDGGCQFDPSFIFQEDLI